VPGTHARARRGASSLGCLFTLLIIAVVIYFGVNIAEVYWRYYEFQDDMAQEVKFSARAPEEQIRNRLKAAADSLGLPDDAHQITVQRSQTMISIEADYDENIELPMYVREVHFHPHAEGPL
jgi:DNA-binding XRE family transcriptional regulator